MSVTIKVNGTVNSLVHKGSNHFSMATIPDVCKTPTPGGPVPLPYPNASMSNSLDKGTTTVKVDGGNMAAIKGSEFSMSQGDEPGTVGGVKSNTFKKESTWITYSFDVKLEGKGACRLTDKKFQNHENTVDIMGTGGAPVAVRNFFKDIVCNCHKTVTASKDDTCMTLGSKKHACCESKLQAHSNSGGTPKAGGEQGYGPRGGKLKKSRASYGQSGGAPPRGSCWPDACTQDASGNPDRFVEFKFKCPKGTKIRKKKNGRWIRKSGKRAQPGWRVYRDGTTQKERYEALGKKLKPPVTKEPLLIDTSGC